MPTEAHYPAPPTMIDDLALLLDRDLAAVQRQIAGYPDDASPWTHVPGCPNTAGTLALHASGNLRHFVGAVLGGTGYVRDREAEFGTRGTSREALVERLGAARTEVERSLAGLDPAALAAPYPIRVADVTMPCGRFLLHLATHLAFHLGQIDYHRRTVTGDPASVLPVSLKALG